MNCHIQHIEKFTENHVKTGKWRRSGVFIVNFEHGFLMILRGVEINQRHEMGLKFKKIILQKRRKSIYMGLNIFRSNCLEVLCRKDVLKN